MMSLQEVKQLEVGEIVGFVGILASTSRQGKFVKLISEYLAVIDYGDHTEQNHITNLF
jgi:hypothetical protein